MPAGPRRRCCWPSTRRPCASTWPSRAAPSRSPTLLPRLRAEGVRPVSSNGVLGDPTGANAEEGRALLDALVRRPGRGRVSALAAVVSPVAVVTGAGRGHGRGDGGSARGRRVAGGGGGPLRRRPGPRLRALDQGRPRGGGRAPRRRRAHGGRRRAQRVGHAGRGRRGRHAFRGPARGRRGGRRDQRRPAGVGDSRRPVGRAVRRQREGRAQPGRRRRCRRCWRRRRHGRDAWWPCRRPPACSGCRA